MSDKTILIADDEADIRRMLGDALRAAGFTVAEASDGVLALHRIRDLTPALVVLDVNMPAMTGFEVCSVLRGEPATIALPVMLVTSRASEVDRVLAFELGVDDYVTKPFSPREVVLRVQNILRRAADGMNTGTVRRAGQLILDVSRMQAFVGTNRLDLSTIELRLLSTLLQQNGKVVSRDALADEAWGIDRTVENRTVDGHIRRLREKLGAEADRLQTIRGVGYRLETTG